MKKALCMLILLCTVKLVSAQDSATCESPKEFIEDLNVINKCLIPDSRTSFLTSKRKVYARFSKTQRRFLRKRIKEEVSTLTSLSTKEVSALEAKTGLSESLQVKALAKVLVKDNFDFTTVDQIPLFKECKNDEAHNQKACFNERITAYINNNLEYPEEAIEEGIQGKVHVSFLITNKGRIKNLNVISSTEVKILNNQVKKLIYGFPNFIPGEKNGQPVDVSYSFSLNFSL